MNNMYLYTYQSHMGILYGVSILHPNSQPVEVINFTKRCAQGQPPMKRPRLGPP